MRSWFDGGEVRFLARASERLAGGRTQCHRGKRGALNSNDALLVFLNGRAQSTTLRASTRASTTWKDSGESPRRALNQREARADASRDASIKLASPTGFEGALSGRDRNATQRSATLGGPSCVRNVAQRCGT